MKLRFLIIIILTVVGVTLFCSLGLWQLERAHEKEAMLAHYAAMEKAQPISFTGNLPEQYQKIYFQGHYDPRIIFLLDNQFYHHQLGYEVIEPFILNNQHIILVSRGWIKAPTDRNESPVITIPTGLREISGTVYFPSKSHLTQALMEDKSWPDAHYQITRIEYIDIQRLQERLHATVYPFIVRLSPTEPNGFVRDWSLVSMPPERHKGYAIQWFAMALVAFIIGGIFLYRSSRTHRS